MASIKGPTKYNAIKFADGTIFNFIPQYGYQPLTRYLIKNACYLYSPQQGSTNKTTKAASPVATISSGSWFFSWTNDDRFRYNMRGQGKPGTVSSKFKDKLLIGSIMSFVNKNSGLDAYGIDFFASEQSSPWLFVEGISPFLNMTFDEVVNANLTVPGYSMSFVMNVINIDRLGEGKFADIEVFTKAGIIGTTMGQPPFSISYSDESTLLLCAGGGALEPLGPYEQGGVSGSGGGDGDFDNTSTPIDIASLPVLSAASTGFISLYNPSLSELNRLASYLWSDLFQIDGWKKIFADPMDAILGLSILPVSIPSAGQQEVKVGNIGTGISLTLASTQFVEVDCGEINVNEYWGAYLDYEPYTQAQIFLPYIGIRPISVDEIMGKSVRVVYHVDILTGACCCFVKCGGSVLYTYNGQCSIPIPITGANYTSVVNGVIGAAAAVGSLVATGGASAPTAISSIATSAVNQMKPQIEKSGSLSGPAGVLNMQIPYLILIRPRQALPSKQNEFIGYPSLVTVQLTELSGYTEVQSIHLENIPATQEELAEIESLLEGGVIF